MAQREQKDTKIEQIGGWEGRLSARRLTSAGWARAKNDCGPWQYQQQGPGIKTSLSFRAMGGVRTRKLPFSPPGVTGGQSITLLSLQWPLASGVCGRRAEEGA